MASIARVLMKSRVMARTSPLYAVIVVIGLGAAQGSAAAAEPKSGSPLGTWRGESKCVVRPSGCHDEIAVYRISPTQSHDRVRVDGNKVVDGNEVNMGSSDCAYDAAARSIDCTLPNSSAVHLEFNGSAMEGRMTLHDGTLWRKITLRRED